jgi:hypothetical protein
MKKLKVVCNENLRSHSIISVTKVAINLLQRFFAKHI